MNTIEHSGKLNGYKVRSWGDLAAVTTVVSVLLALFVGVLFWGLKLESELNSVRENYGLRIAALESRLSDGILQVQGERLNHIYGDVQQLNDNIGDLEVRLNIHIDSGE